MHKIAVLHFRDIPEKTETVTLLDKEIAIQHIGCNLSLEVMAYKIKELDGTVDAIALDGVAKALQLGGAKVAHPEAEPLFKIAEKTPVTDGAGVRSSLERWAVRLAHKAQPGIWSRKRIMMAPGVNHMGLAYALTQYTEEVRYADPVIFFALPAAPGVGWEETLKTAAGPTLDQLQEMPFRRIFPQAGTPGQERSDAPFKWADVIAGDMASIRRYAPQSLKRKVIITEYATQEDVDDLTAREAEAIVTTVPPLREGLAHLSASVFEGLLIALREDKDAPLNENTYLNLMADLHWKPGIQFLKPQEEQVNRFAFVIHPLSSRFISNHPMLRWTKYLPQRLVELVAAEFPPLHVSRIRGIVSPATGQKIEGELITIGATPKELMRRDPAFAYRRLIKASRMSERLGARIMGLGAFTSVVGDAGITVAQKADIAITSGNSLTVAATLETAKQAVVKMGNSLDDAHKGNVMVIGATGSIGSVCSRLLAQAVANITLVAPRPEKLISLKRTIEEESPHVDVKISTKADDYVHEADLVVTTTSAFGQRIIDITKCKPGAVICDIARPPDISKEEADLRPDVLVIESGEILLPGEPDFGFDIGLPPGVAYACLAETALLALDGRFEDYTVGRNIDMERVKEIYRLYKKHGLQLSGIRSHDEFLTDEDIAHKRALADELRADAQKLAQVKSEGAEKLRQIPINMKDNTSNINIDPMPWVLGGMAALGGLLFWRKRKN